jgi:hypothetical protein
MSKKTKLEYIKSKELLEDFLEKNLEDKYYKNKSNNSLSSKYKEEVYSAMIAYNKKQSEVSSNKYGEINSINYKSKFKKEFSPPSTKNTIRSKLKKHLFVEDFFIKNKKIFDSINSEYKEFLALINKEKINTNYNLFPKRFKFDNFIFLDVSKLDYNDTLSYYSIVIFLSEIKLSYFSYRKLIKKTNCFNYIKFN